MTFDEMTVTGEPSGLVKRFPRLVPKVPKNPS